MTSLSIKEVKLTSVSIVMALFLSCSLFLGSQPAHAARKYTNCPETIYSMLFVDLKQPLYGTTYVKLANKIPDSNVTLYTIDANDDAKCSQLGQAPANSQNWAPISTINQNEAVKQVFADGPTKSADVYQSTVKLLKITDPKICQQIDSECHTTYKGHNGVLQPKLLTGGTDSIAVYTVLPINDSKVKEVAYYSDGSFLYINNSKQIDPVNKNYLSDGSHNVVTRVTFENGQVLNISQKYDLGKDFTGFTTVRSYYYKSHNRYLYILIALVSAIIISLIIWAARTIHQRREFKKDHGIENLSVPEVKKDETKDKIVVG